MSKLKNMAVFSAMLVGVMIYTSPAKSAVCFLPDDDGSCGGGDIEISDDSTSENQCADFTLSQNQRNSKEYDSDCYTCEHCTYNGRTTYKCALNSGATWYGGNLSVCCTNGEKYDSAEGKCCPAGGCAHNCPEGQSWDSSTKSCKCDNGKDANGGICCADSEHVSDGICCPEKKHNDGGVCKCDSQYNTDDDGNCIPQNNIKTTITVQYSLNMSRQGSSSWLNLTFKVLSASDAKSHHVELTFNPMDGAEPTNCTISYPLTFGTNTKTNVQCGSIYSMMNTPKLTNVSVDNSNVAASIRLDQLDNSTVQNDKYVIKLTKAAVTCPNDYLLDYQKVSDCPKKDNYDVKIETTSVYSHIDKKSYTCGKCVYGRKDCQTISPTYFNEFVKQDKDPQDVCPYFYSTALGNLVNTEVDKTSKGTYISGSKVVFDGSNAIWKNSPVEGCYECGLELCNKIDSDYGNSTLVCADRRYRPEEISRYYNLERNWAVGDDGACYECIRPKTTIGIHYKRDDSNNISIGCYKSPIPSKDNKIAYNNWLSSLSEWYIELWELDDDGEYWNDDEGLPFDVDIITNYTTQCRDGNHSWEIYGTTYQEKLHLPKGAKYAERHKIFVDNFVRDFISNYDNKCNGTCPDIPGDASDDDEWSAGTVIFIDGIKLEKSQYRTACTDYEYGYRCGGFKDPDLDKDITYYFVED